MQSLCLIIALLAVDPPQIFSATGIYARAQQDQAVSIGDQYYAVMFTASYCSPCRQYKDSGKFRELKTFLPLSTQVDIQEHPEWLSDRTVTDPSTGKPVTQKAVSALPEFWLVRRNADSTTWPVKRWNPGAVPPSEIYAHALELFQQTKDSSDVK